MLSPRCSRAVRELILKPEVDSGLLAHLGVGRFRQSSVTVHCYVLTLQWRQARLQLHWNMQRHTSCKDEHLTPCAEISATWMSVAVDHLERVAMLLGGRGSFVVCSGNAKYESVPYIILARARRLSSRPHQLLNRVQWSRTTLRRSSRV